jgi:hypothetical protein
MLLQTSRFLLVGCWPINCTRGATAVPSSAAIHTSRKRSRGGVRRVRASAYAPRYTGTGQVPKKKTARSIRLRNTFARIRTCTSKPAECVQASNY